jgi:integrase
MYHCGLRLNELCHLRVSDLDAARGMLRVIGDVRVGVLTKARPAPSPLADSRN